MSRHTSRTTWRWMKYYSSVSLFFKFSIRAITESLKLSAMEWASISLSWASSARHCATKEAYLGKISATRMPQRFLQPSWTKESHGSSFSPGPPSSPPCTGLPSSLFPKLRSGKTLSHTEDFKEKPYLSNKATISWRNWRAPYLFSGLQRPNHKYHKIWAAT